MAYLRCSTETLREGVLVRVNGDVDLATAPLLADHLTKAFGAHFRVIVDLDSVPYLGSAGLHVLARTAARYAGQFVVVQSTARLRRLLDILGVNGLLPVVTSIAEAEEYLRNHDDRADGGASRAAGDMD
ncbi:MAG TPA: STAS domain-containing protein [bacterium]|nr:STAS domain-containing protein [bacterium]